METPVPRIYLFPWESKTFCFDFQDDGALQGPTPAVLTSPDVTYLAVSTPPGSPDIGVPAVILTDFWNAKGETPRKVPAGKGVAVRFSAPLGASSPGSYPVKCVVLADGTEPLTQAAILVVSETPEA